MHGRLRRLFGIGATAVACVALVLYSGDYLALQFRIPDNRPQFGSVHIQRLIAVPQKNGKIEFIKDEPIDQPCVHSIFPHFGDDPCWYLEKHTRQTTNL